MLLLTSCARFGDVIIYPDGVYEVSVDSLSSTNCKSDTPTIGDNVFFVSSINDQETAIEIGGLSGECFAGNDSGYVTSYARPCHFLDDQGNSVEVQLGLDFNLRGFVGNAEVTTGQCIIKYDIVGKKR